MKRSVLCVLFAMFSLTLTGQATIVTLSGSRTGPLAILSDDTVLSNALIRLGTFNALPESTSIRDIDAVFEEFATGFTAADGRIGQTFNNLNGTDFNGQQIYIWLVDPVLNYNQGIFTVSDASNPGVGNPWLFPVHTGSGTDSTTISLEALLTPGGADTSFRPESFVDPRDGGRLGLPAPEPSSALLGFMGLLLLIRRRR